jgi:hypothetical protein
MLIIETIAELVTFTQNYSNDNWVVIPTYCNGELPVYIDKLSVVYVYVLDKDIEALMIFNHTEGLSMSEDSLSMFPSNNQMYVYGKKKFKKFIDSKSVIDLDMIEYFANNRFIDEDFDTSAHEYFIRQFGKFTDLNAIIPVSKHIEKSQAILNRFLQVYDSIQIDESFNCYNNLILDSLFQIEKNGIHVNKSIFQKYFAVGQIHDDLVYTEYNPYTLTGRPSNRFGGINYAALKKEDGSRAAFNSRFNSGMIVSFDYDAYHLRLLATLVDFEFPKGISVHEYLGKQYFDKDILTPEEYSESKSISFRQLYGGIGSEYMHIPFFQKIHEYTSLIWHQYMEQDFIETPLFNRKLYKRFYVDMNPSKLLNYLLQAFETERNMAVIQNLLGRTRACLSKLILYTYDSFTWDFNPLDGADLIKIVYDELTENGKYPVKIEVGPNYQDLIVSEIKL